MSKKKTIAMVKEFRRLVEASKVKGGLNSFACAHMAVALTDAANELEKYAKRKAKKARAKS